MNIHRKYEVGAGTGENDLMSTTGDEEYVATGSPKRDGGHPGQHISNGNMFGLNATAILVGLIMTLGPLAAYALGAR